MPDGGVLDDNVGVPLAKDADVFVNLVDEKPVRGDVEVECPLGAAEKEIHCVHAADAILGGGRHRVERDHGLRIVVANVEERLEFAFEDALAAKRLRDLVAEKLKKQQKI